MNLGTSPLSIVGHVLQSHFPGNINVLPASRHCQANHGHHIWPLLVQVLRAHPHPRYTHPRYTHPRYSVLTHPKYSVLTISGTPWLNHPGYPCSPIPGTPCSPLPGTPCRHPTSIALQARLKVTSASWSLLWALAGILSSAITKRNKSDFHCP